MLLARVAELEEVVQLVDGIVLEAEEVLRGGEFAQIRVEPDDLEGEGEPGPQLVGKLRASACSEVFVQRVAVGVVVDALAGGRDRLRELVEGRVAAIEALLGNLESIGVDEFVGILVNLFGKALLQEVVQKRERRKRLVLDDAPFRHAVVPDGFEQRLRDGLGFLAQVVEKLLVEVPHLVVRAPLHGCGCRVGGVADELLEAHARGEAAVELRLHAVRLIEQDDVELLKGLLEECLALPSDDHGGEAGGSRDHDVGCQGLAGHGLRWAHVPVRA